MSSRTLRHVWPLGEGQSQGFVLLLFSHQVVSLWPHGLQHTRPPCPSPSPGVCSSSCPLSWWCHPTISSSAALFSFAFNLSQHQGLFQWVSCSYQVANYWSFSFSVSSSNEYLGLLSFRIDWFELLVVQGTLKSLHQYHSLKDHICTWLLAYRGLCRESDVSAF